MSSCKSGMKEIGARQYINHINNELRGEYYYECSKYHNIGGTESVI